MGQIGVNFGWKAIVSL